MALEIVEKSGLRPCTRKAQGREKPSSIYRPAPIGRRPHPRDQPFGDAAPGPQCLRGMAAAGLRAGGASPLDQVRPAGL